MRRTRDVIAFCGTRGLPANYGGFETAVDEITKRVIAVGYPCEVFCRKPAGASRPPEHLGRVLVYVTGSRWRSLDTFMSSIQTGWYLIRNRKRYAFVFWFNNANFPGILMTWLARIPMALNTDGLEWRRAKWSWPFKLYYLVTSFLVARLCRTLISDSVAIQEYYRERFWRRTHMIPYGAPSYAGVSAHRTAQILERLCLNKGRYFLQITRFEPDNLPLAAARAFQHSGLSSRTLEFVLVGFKDPTSYALQVKRLDGEGGVRVLDAVYDPEVLEVLRTNCFCYVHGNAVGGTNPALLEAMTACPRIMAIDSPFSHEVLGGLGLYFKRDQIAECMQRALDSEDQRDKLQARVNALYQWDTVADSYLRLAHGLPADYAIRRKMKCVELEAPTGGKIVSWHQ